MLLVIGHVRRWLRGGEPAAVGDGIADQHGEQEDAHPLLSPALQPKVEVGAELMTQTNHESKKNGRCGPAARRPLRPAITTGQFTSAG